jgi:ketohexokinase
LTFESFSKLCLDKYKHIHFEGRNVEEVKKMISFIRRSDPMREIKISIELELAKNELLDLLNQDVDIFFVERDFVSLLNCTNIDETIKVIAQRVHSTAIVICPWAESGAKAIDNQNKQICSSPAFKPKTGVVDTLGAGDTFLAATLFALQILNYKLQEAIEFGCRVAGAKCGAHGFQHLHKFQEYI